MDKPSTREGEGLLISNVARALAPAQAGAAQGRFGCLARQIEPEWLDHLPVDDPAAQASRRDLRRLNACMGNARLMARWLRRVAAELHPECLAELGAGDGRFLLAVGRRLTRLWPEVHVELVDRQAVISSETQPAFADLGWSMQPVQADAFEWLAARQLEPSRTIMVANLFLHHFSERRLAELFAHISRQAAVFIALEPRRSVGALFCSGLVGLLGCNSVTRHDAPASVRAGFNGNELARLWPPGAGWELTEGAAGMFGHLFAARHVRRAGAAEGGPIAESNEPGL